MTPTRDELTRGQVQTYHFAKARRHRVLEVKFGGSACGKTNYQNCPKTYRFERGGLFPAK